MRIAIFHNYMDNIGGAEKVVLTLARELHADIYTTNFDLDKIKKMGFKNIKIYSVGKVPINAPFRQQFAVLRLKKCDLRGKYDFFIIGGDWAFSAAYHNKPNLWYIHSPIGEIWDLYRFTRRNTVPFYERPLFDLWVYYNRHLNREYAKYVDKVVCNSFHTQQKVKQFLKKESNCVIFPPVDTKRFRYKKNGDYWLSVNRLINHKMVELQMETFKKMPKEKLIVVGCYEKAKHFLKYKNYVKNIKPKNVKLLEKIPYKKLIELYSNCKGFIATSHNEGFGMSVVEAMASGKPVIATNEGGHRETVIDGVTGRLVNNVDELVKAIKEVSKNPKAYKEACLKRAKDFDTKIFIEKIKKEIN